MERLGFRSPNHQIARSPDFLSSVVALIAMMRFVLAILLFATASAQDWKPVSVNTTASLRGLSVVNDKIVWASGTGGTVIRTTDSGKTWSVLTVTGAESLDFRGIRAFDANTAVIISSGPAEKGQARIYRTTDAGKSWNKVFEQNTAGIFFDAIAFWDQKHGIVLSDPVAGKFALFTTDDGGLTWKQIPAAALPDALPNEGAFAASNSCLSVQETSNVWFATGGAKVARVFRSADRGKTWTVAETPMHPANASSGIFSLAFSDANHGVAVGGDYQKPDGSDLLNALRTEDSGKTWEAVEPSTPKGVYLSSVTYLKEYSAVNAFVAVGTKGVYVYANGWSKGTDKTLNVVVSPSKASAWVAGPAGFVGLVEWDIDFGPPARPAKKP